MGLTTRNLQSQIVTTEDRFIYEIRDKRGKPFRHCGSVRDVEIVLEHYPSSTYHKVYLSKSPETVDVPSIRVGEEQVLPMQQILPESQLQPLDL